MSIRLVQVRSPSRLHFGLLPDGDNRRYGGAGVMVQRPGLELAIGASGSFGCEGPASDRVRRFAETWATFHGRPLPDCHVRVLSCPPQHVGLGVGTQMGMSVAAGLCAFRGIAPGGSVDLAASVERGKRSAIGAHGFCEGGFIVDRGKSDGRLAPLDCRAEFPDAWRFVLVQPVLEPGLAGEEEKLAFARRPAPSSRRRETLARLLRERMAPAVIGARFEEFAASLGEYSQLAGLEFSDVQGGAFNGPLLTELVRQMRSLGAEGVGQSSWGPTLFAVLPDAQAADNFARRLRELAGCQRLRVEVTAANNHGAEVSVREHETGGR